MKSIKQKMEVPLKERNQVYQSQKMVFLSFELLFVQDAGME